MSSCNKNFWNFSFNINTSKIWFITTIETKCKFIAFISAKHKKEDDKELFHFEKAILLSGLTFEKFLEAVKKGYIQYDIRIGVYRTGKNKGKSHDHGSGFRIKKNRIDEIFKVEEI